MGQCRRQPCRYHRRCFEREKYGPSENTAIVGTIKDPSMEALLACEPDFVIMSADITSHAELGSTLDEAGIAWGLFHVDILTIILIC